MKQKAQKRGPIKQPTPKKRSFKDVAVLCALFAVPAALIFWVAQRAPRNPLTNPGTTSLAAAASNTLLVAQTPIQPSVPAPLPVVPATGDPRELVTRLSEVDFTGTPLSSEQIGKWKSNLQGLIQQGVTAVPAIHEFLDKNLDLDFDASKGGDALGYPTLRVALLDALSQIKTRESVAALLKVLHATADPREIATVSKGLEQQAPGQHRQACVSAARDALALAGRGQLEDHDVGPLFEVLQQFGSAEVVPDLEQVASKYNFYTTIALGGLAGGAGVPALIRMTQDVSIQNVMAWRVLAQMAAKKPEAKAVLVNQVRSNAMPYSAWAGIQAALSGDVMEYGAPILTTGAAPAAGASVRTYHINYGHQNYRTFPVAADWPQDRIKEQLGVIDELIAVDANLETLQFLQEARLGLAARLDK